MFDTAITMCGNVLTAPEWRRTANTGTYVMTFRFASTSRRFDRTSGQWIDGDSLRVKVACWRTLGQNAFESIQLGDPLVIYGRLYSRDWVDSEDHKRTSYELDAISVGHDLARGVAKFLRRKPAGATDSVDDAEGRAAIGGEASEHVDPPGRPAGMPPVDQLFADIDRERFVDPAQSAEYVEDGDDDESDDTADDESDEIADIEAELTVAA
ncbi:MAG TPA: single-stranded DNA-binding protein [Micromonosporaceae bacterium]